MPQIAIKVVDAGLRDDFGFKHRFWVYSGRRGVHCWVCDERARLMTNEQRSAVAEYFSVYKGSDQGKKARGARAQRPPTPAAAAQRCFLSPPLQFPPLAAGTDATPRNASLPPRSPALPEQVAIGHNLHPALSRAKEVLEKFWVEARRL